LAAFAVLGVVPSASTPETPEVESWSKADTGRSVSRRLLVQVDSYEGYVWL